MNEIHETSQIHVKASKVSYALSALVYQARQEIEAANARAKAAEAEVERLRAAMAEIANSEA